MLTTKEKEKKFLESLNLKEGDKIILYVGSEHKVFNIYEGPCTWYLSSCSMVRPIGDLIVYPFEKSECKPTYRTLKCCDISCRNCPLSNVCTKSFASVSLYHSTLQDNLDKMDHLNQRERDFYQSEIDKVI